MSKSIIAIFMLAVAVPAFAGQAPPAPHPSTGLGALRAAQPADPYGKLFEVKRSLQSALQAARPALQPKVVCGMTIVPADPSIDPKMAIPRQSAGVDYKIRAIDPPVCNPAK